MNFELLEEQRMVRDMVREFADREMVPRIPEMERRGEYPAQIIRQLSEIGIMGMAIPEEFGGSGFDTVSIILALEEIARACASTAITVSVHNSAAAAPIVRFGTAEQKRRYLPRMASGEIIGGFALTEPGCGS